ncbi:MAG: MOSC domain-containing protein [Bacteroidota bacterium]
MKVVSVNLGEKVSFPWNGETHTTGIFKNPVDNPIHLGKEGVADDVIANPKVHGGVFKACYLFSANHYPYWQEKYPHLEWQWGMFGENVSVENLDEATLCIGDVYQLGEALVQITQPREPCYKLGYRFENQGILKEFIDHGYPGTYVRIMEEGKVQAGDSMTLHQKSDSALTVKAFYELLYMRQKSKSLLELAIANTALPERKREKLKKYL